MPGPVSPEPPRSLGAVPSPGGCAAGVVPGCSIGLSSEGEKTKKKNIKKESRFVVSLLRMSHSDRSL